MINDVQKDFFKEIINIGVGRAADLLNTIINKHITLEVPYIKISELENLEVEMNSPGSDSYSLVNMKFDGKISGNANLLFTSIDATLLVNTFVGEENEHGDIDALKSGALNEIGNIVLNSLIGTFSNYLKENLEYSVPEYNEGELKHLLKINSDKYEDTVIVAHTRFNIDELDIVGDFILLLELGASDVLINNLNLLGDNYFEE